MAMTVALQPSLAAQQRPGRRLWGVPLPVVFFFLGMILPTAISVSVGGMRLSAYRIVLLVMFVPMIWTLVTGARGKLNIFDGFAIAHSVWALLALIKWGGLAQGLESGGIYVVEALGAYLIGRLYIRSYEDFRAMATAYVGTVVGMLAFTIPEALTGTHFLKDTAASLFGGAKAHFIDKRMGLERAFGSFDHPILYGVFSASAFSMAYYICAGRSLSNMRGMLKVIGVIAATFISASGGPYVVLLMQIFVAGWDRALQFVGRWRLLFTLMGLTYVGIDLFSNRTPFHVFVSYFTFSAHSAYNRINIWIYGTAEVARHPIFGIGLGDWIRAPWMSDSMDNFWLLITVRYGVPALLFLLATVFGLVIAAGLRKNLPLKWRHARHAWAFTLFGISVAAATVHLWNALFVLFMFLVGAGAWMADPSVRPKSRALRPQPKPRRAPTLF